SPGDLSSRKAVGASSKKPHDNNQGTAEAAGRGRRKRLPNRLHLRDLMTHRERHTPDEAPARDATWNLPARPSASGSLSGAVKSPLGDAILWTDWYHRAAPLQQHDALLRSIQQGILSAHQLPIPARTAVPSRSVLFGLLNGQIKDLEPLNPPLLEYCDPDLDERQRDAVARAVATPDVCLIQGFPGTGK